MVDPQGSPFDQDDSQSQDQPKLASGNISTSLRESAVGKNADYELLPHEELEQLRREIRQMRRNPLGDSDSSSLLLMKLDELNKNIARFVSILDSVNKTMLDDFQKNNPSGKLGQVLDQNQKIASGIVALADMLKKISIDMQLAQGRSERQPVFASQGLGVGPSQNSSSPLQPGPSFTSPRRQGPAGFGSPSEFAPSSGNLSLSDQVNASAGQNFDPLMSHSAESLGMQFPPRPPSPGLGSSSYPGAGVIGNSELMPPPPLPGNAGGPPDIPLPPGVAPSSLATQAPTPFTASGLPPPPTRRGLFGRIK